MMMLATVAFIACAYPLSFPWFFAWRVVSGAAGGVLMVLAATTVLPHVMPSRRGFAGGVIFMGVGAGIVASGTLVPLLLRQGLAQTWLGLGIVSLILTLIAWRGWPSETRPAATSHNRRRTHEIRGWRALYAEYGLNAVGLVPHMVFLVYFVARGLCQGPQAGAACWVLFGLGALAGPIVSGHLADRIGFGPALRVAFVIEAVAVALPVLGPSQTWLVSFRAWSSAPSSRASSCWCSVACTSYSSTIRPSTRRRGAWRPLASRSCRRSRPTACHTCSCRAPVHIS